MSDPAIPVASEHRAMRLADSTAIAAAVAAIVVLPIALSAVDALPAGVVHDDGMYVILAKSLATGHGYRWLNLPGEPHATHYPPGYPTLLSLVWRIAPSFPANVVVFKLLNAILLAAAAAVLAMFTRERLRLSSQAACLVAIAGCAAVPVLVLSNLVMSEILFLALLLPALLFAERTLERERIADHEAVLLALAGGLLMLVRSHGVAFVGAVAFALLVRRAIRPLAIFLMTAAAAALPWHVWQSTYSGVLPAPMRGSYESYGSWLLGGAGGHPLAFVGRTVAATSNEIFLMLRVLTTSGLPSEMRFTVAVVAIGLLCLGLAALWRRARVTALFLAGYLGILLVWPFTPSRFVWGIWPLLVLTFASGVLAVKDWRPDAAWGHALRGALAVAAVLVLGGYGVYNVRGYRGRWWSSIGRSAVSVAGESVAWVATHTAPGAVVSTNDEPMVYLYTGRQAVPATSFVATDYFAPPTVASRAEALRSILQSYHVDALAIVASDSLQIAARRMSAEQPPSLVLRDSVPYGLMFSLPSISR